jgi:hypothetical protein
VSVESVTSNRICTSPASKRRSSSGSKCNHRGVWRRRLPKSPPAQARKDCRAFVLSAARRLLFITVIVSWTARRYWVKESPSVGRAATLLLTSTNVTFARVQPVHLARAYKPGVRSLMGGAASLAQIRILTRLPVPRKHYSWPNCRRAK